MLHAMTCMTISLNISSAGNNVNIITGKAEVEVDIRILPGQDETYVLNQLNLALKDFEGKYEITSIENSFSYLPGFTSSMESSLINSYKDAIQSLYPDFEMFSFLGLGATDARFCVPAGIVCYGLGIFNPDLKLEDFGPAHGIDEKIDLKTINLNLKVFYSTISNFLES